MINFSTHILDQQLERFRAEQAERQWEEEQCQREQQERQARELERIRELKNEYRRERLSSGSPLPDSSSSLDSLSSLDSSSATSVPPVIHSLLGPIIGFITLIGFFVGLLFVFGMVGFFMQHVAHKLVSPENVPVNFTLVSFAIYWFIRYCVWWIRKVARAYEWLTK